MNYNDCGGFLPRCDCSPFGGRRSREDHEAFLQHQRDRIEAAREHDAEQACEFPLCAVHHICDRNCTRNAGVRAGAPDPWHDAVLAECMAIEGCYREADPAGTVKCLIDWHVQNATPGVALPAQSVPVAVLRQHWLTAMECDHESKRDKPHCSCSLVDLGWHPSIGAAVEAWLAHVSGVGIPQTTKENDRG